MTISRHSVLILARFSRISSRYCSETMSKVADRHIFEKLVLTDKCHCFRVARHPGITHLRDAPDQISDLLKDQNLSFRWRENPQFSWIFSRPQISRFWLAIGQFAVPQSPSRSVFRITPVPPETGKLCD